jgi:hypothetical protein
VTGVKTLPIRLKQRKRILVSERKLINDYEKDSLHPFEARILNGREQKALKNRDARYQGYHVHTTRCFDRSWRDDPIPDPPPEVRLFTTAEGIYPDLNPTAFWETPYFRQRVINLVAKQGGNVKHDGHSFPPQPFVRFVHEHKKARPPVLLHVCRDSREFAMEHYQLSFGGSHNSTNELFSTTFKKSRLGQKQIWIDFKRDTILIKHHSPTLQSFIPTKSYLQIQNLAVVAGRIWYQPDNSLPHVSDADPWQRCLLRVLTQLPKLKNLVVYYDLREQWATLWTGDGELFSVAVEKTLLHILANPQEVFPGEEASMSALKVNVRMEKLVVSEYLDAY